MKAQFSFSLEFDNTFHKTRVLLAAKRSDAGGKLIPVFDPNTPRSDGQNFLEGKEREGG